MMYLESTVLSTKFIILAIFIVSTMYIHYRGSVRHKLTRQLLDHSTLVAPINCFMYLFSKVPNTAYVDVNTVPELQLFRDNWQIIREEVIALASANAIKASDKYDDAGFNSFFRNGWKRFYLKWYRDFHPSAKQHCPKTIELIKRTPCIKAAMFAALEPGGKLVRHRDPYAGSLRYHLGIITPNSDDCAIVVDGQAYSWRDGEDVLFDETYIHYAYNQTDKERIIFFCDVERPMKWKLPAWINRIFARIVLAAASAPNFATDKTGMINRLFKYIYAVRRVGKRMKAWNHRCYYLVKYLLFAAILYLLFFS